MWIRVAGRERSCYNHLHSKSPGQITKGLYSWSMCYYSQVARQRLLCCSHSERELCPIQLGIYGVGPASWNFISSFDPMNMCFQSEHCDWLGCRHLCQTVISSNWVRMTHTTETHTTEGTTQMWTPCVGYVKEGRQTQGVHICVVLSDGEKAFFPVKKSGYGQSTFIGVSYTFPPVVPVNKTKTAQLYSRKRIFSFQSVRLILSKHVSVWVDHKYTRFTPLLNYTSCHIT